MHSWFRLHRYIMGDTCFMDCQSISCFIKFAYATGDMQRIGVQLHTYKRDSRDKLWMDTGNGSRHNTGRTDIRNRRSE
jgi:hypothetical protein